jgi:hypothetical protein
VKDIFGGMCEEKMDVEVQDQKEGKTTWRRK